MAKIRRILNKIYNNRDFNYILKHGPYKLYYELGLFIPGFLIFWLFANYSSSEFYGTYLYVLSIIAFFSFLSFDGIKQSLTQSAANGYDFFLYSAVRKILIYSLLGTIGIIAFAILNFFFHENSIVILISLTIGGFFFPLKSALSSYHSFLDGKTKFKENVIYSFVEFIASSILVILLIFLIKNLILFFLFNFVLQTLISIVFLKRSLIFMENTSRDDSKEYNALNYGIFLTKYNLLSLFCSNINNLIIGLFFGPIELAFYIVGINPIIYLQRLIKPTFSVLLTKYSDTKAKISKFFLISVFLFSLLMFFGVIIILPYYLSILFPGYLSALDYGFLYSFSLILYPLNIVLNYYFRGKVAKKVVRYSRVIPELISLILIIPFIIFLGIIGIVFAELIKTILKFIIFVSNIKREII